MNEQASDREPAAASPDDVEAAITRLREGVAEWREHVWQKVVCDVADVAALLAERDRLMAVAERAAMDECSWYAHRPEPCGRCLSCFARAVLASPTGEGR